MFLEYHLRSRATVLVLVLAGVLSGQTPGGPARSTTPIPPGSQVGPYTGPVGGGPAPFPGPSGGGTQGPTLPPGVGGVPPGLPGGTKPGHGTPLNPVGGSISAGMGGRTQGPQPPVGPLPPPAPAGPPLPNVPPPTAKNATPYGLPFPSDRWENWWILNKDRFLDLTQAFAVRSRDRTISGDEFLDTDVPAPGAYPILMYRREARARIVPVLAALVDDGNPIVRGEAALALGKIGGADVLPRLRHTTEDSNRFVRQLGLLGCGLTGEPEALTFLATFLLDDSQQDAERAFAALGLAVLGRSEALPALATVLNRPGVDRNLEAAVLYALGFIPDESAVILLKEASASKTRSGDLRAVAVSALAKHGDPSLVPHLLRAIEDPETPVRRSAALALGQIPFESGLWARRDELLETIRTWKAGRGMTEEAIRRFEDHVAEVEKKAAAETRAMQEVQLKVVDALAKTTADDRDRMARHFAAMALGRIGSPEARLELGKAFARSTSNDATTGFLALAMGVARAKESSSVLRRSLIQKGLDPSTRGAIMVSLGLLDDLASGEALVSYASNESNPDLRANAALAAGLMNFAAARKPFREVLREETQSFLRPVFGLALGLLGDSESLDVLEGLALDAGSASVTRVEACRSLASMHDLAAAKALVRVLDPQLKTTDIVRAVAAHALGQVAEKTALPGLEPLARDWNYLLPFPVINDAILR